MRPGWWNVLRDGESLKRADRELAEASLAAMEWLDGPQVKPLPPEHPEDETTQEDW